MESRADMAAVRARYRLAKHAVSEAVRENKRQGLSEAEPQTEQEINAESAALDITHWKSVPVALHAQASREILAAKFSPPSADCPG